MSLDTHDEGGASSNKAKAALWKLISDKLL